MKVCTLVRNSKNLIPFPYDFDENTSNGVTMKVNPDGSITLNGTATSQCIFGFKSHLTHTWTNSSVTLFSGLEETNWNIMLNMADFKDGVYVTEYSDYGNAINFTIQGNLVGFNIIVNAGTVCDNVKLHPMIVVGSYTKETMPSYYELAPQKLLFQSRNSKNLIPFPYPTMGTSANGITFTVLNDGGVRVVTDGASTGYASMTLMSTNPFKVGKTYRICLNIPDSSGMYFYVRYTANGSTVYKNQNSSYNTFTWEEGFEFGSIWLQVNPNTTIDTIVYPILVEGDDELPYYELAPQKVLFPVRSSKNLIPFPYLFTETTFNGVTYKVHADGSITLDGVCTQTGNLDIQENIPVNQGDVLTINSTSPQNWDTWYIMVSAFLGRTFKKNYFGNKLTNKIVLDVECDNIVIRLTSYAGMAFENLNFNFSVCAGETALPYYELK